MPCTTQSIPNVKNTEHSDGVLSRSQQFDLIAAAEELACAQILIDVFIEEGRSVSSTICRVCHRGSRSGQIQHASLCAVGRVMNLAAGPDYPAVAARPERRLTCGARYSSDTLLEIAGECSREIGHHGNHCDLDRDLVWPPAAVNPYRAPVAHGAAR